MFKLLGMIVGAGLILLAGMAWLDAPNAKKVSSQIHTELDQVIDQIDEQDSITPEAVKEKIPEVVKDLAAQVIEQIPDKTPLDESLPEKNLLEESLPEDSLLEENLPEENLENEVLAEEIKQLDTSDSPWHIFWKPFDSVKSAEGFAQRLSQQTGIEISVISNEMGKHRLTFPYIDEADKQRILQLIQEKTGLEP